jgi:hypothetical protein
MAFTKSADGVASKGKTKGKNLGDSGPTAGKTVGGKGKGSSGGKTNADLMSMGRNLAKVANQKRG